MTQTLLSVCAIDLSTSNFDVGGAIFVSIWGAMFFCFAFWMIFWPDSYLSAWKKYLRDAEGASPFNPLYANREIIKLHATTGNPKKKARNLGIFFILAVVFVELVIWRVLIYGPFGT